ncbi:hypothetical protein Slin_0765 [Spirosoma linguale DSM 74]|uniref:Uncharacterized protein n=1 Tax=Spirosoma linguale (strain ATCC 33905 / DSM 74 / LMG 10896 / Claus 1) TaxID=504472 RepID=D2QH62_SPILD|nr:hypothetical protein Slin_0765 [Spirosoma linguale DSM 74]
MMASPIDNTVKQTAGVGSRVGEQTGKFWLLTNPRTNAHS